MTCILVAHLGREVAVAADKRAVQYKTDGTLTVACDDVHKIVRTPAGIVTGCGMASRKGKGAHPIGALCYFRKANRSRLGGCVWLSTSRLKPRYIFLRPKKSPQ